MAKEKTQLTAEMIAREVVEFRRQHRTLILASSSEAQEPLASYAPFIEDEQGHFYVLLSGLAAHSTNLLHHTQTGRLVSVLLIEDEQQTRNLFARKRLSYQCEVQVFSRKTSRWQPLIELMQERLGKTIEVLAGLGDFQLFCLMPKQGNYVRGFGQAYELDERSQPVEIRS